MSGADKGGWEFGASVVRLGIFLGLCAPVILLREANGRSQPATGQDMIMHSRET
jgi:hypothetical protein